jgi:MoxR-like ATPase
VNTETKPTTDPTTMPQCWRDFHTLMEADTRRVILYGVPGTGKTYAGLTYGKMNGAHRLICTEEMTDADIVGCWQPSREGWHWREGKAITAWRNGDRLVIDEVDKANGDVLAVLLAMTDTVESASWRNPETGEVVTPHPDFSVVMTTNLERMADLPDALTDRFPIALRINTPHPDALARIPEQYRSTAVALADSNDEARASMRAFLELSRLEIHIGRAEAARLIFGDRAADLVQTWNIAEAHAEAAEAAGNEAAQ